MTSPNFSLGARKALLGIILLGTALRLAAAWYQGNSVEVLPGIHDQLSYHALAVRVLEGHGFSFEVNWWPATKAGEPTAHWSFPYTLYLAGIYSIFGTNPLAGRLAQALMVGILQPWLTWRIARRLFTDRVALVAAAISAVYAYFVYYAGALMTEAFYILAILWAFDVATRLQGVSGRTGGARETALWLHLGCALGVAVLLRQVFLLFVPVLLGWLVLRRTFAPAGAPPQPPDRRLSRAAVPARGALLCLAVVVLLVAPWTVRNYLAFDQFVLLNTNAGFAFFWGNHPIHQDRFIPILPADGPSYGELLPEELKGLNEAALDRSLLSLGIGFVRNEPMRYLRLSLSRIPEYFKFWPTGDSSLLSNFLRVSSFGLMLPFALIGFFQVGKKLFFNFPRFESVKELDWVPLILFVVVYSLIHFFSWTLVRYRLPIDGLLILFAASGLVAALHHFSTTLKGINKKPLATLP